MGQRIRRILRRPAVIGPAVALALALAAATAVGPAPAPGRAHRLAAAAEPAGQPAAEPVEGQYEVLGPHGPLGHDGVLGPDGPVMRYGGSYPVRRPSSPAVTGPPATVVRPRCIVDAVLG